MGATEVSPNPLDAALDVLQHSQICNTVAVCCLMSRIWGDLQDEDIAKAVKSPTDHRSGICIRIIEDFLTEPQLRGADLFGALSYFERWRKVRAKFIEREYIRDTSDEEENAAREIWDQAMEELGKQG